MLLSQYFLPVLKEHAADAQIVSHNLMLRAGMIKQSCSGIYNWLPLGVKVLNKIEQIIRSNMDSCGCIEVRMPCIQSSALWSESGRYEDYGQEMLKMTDRHGQEMLFGPTNEEVITDIFRHTIKSYRDLPKNFYQIQWKFRDEIRPRFGVMRSREFLMKDAYSFDMDLESAKKSYKLMYEVYLTIFRELGLKVIPVQADNGPIGGSLSHEFHILAKTGESQLYYDKQFEQLLDGNIEQLESLYAVSEEKYSPQSCTIPEDSIITSRGIEVGHIFLFGTKYTEIMKAYVNDSTGKRVTPNMGSYGIGISRLVGAIIEANYDEKGIIWPINIAPFKVSIINLFPSDEKYRLIASQLYDNLIRRNIEVLYDDTDNSPGSKFKTHDLIGIPYHIIVGRKALDHAIVELKDRRSNNIEEQLIGSVINKLTDKLYAA